MSKMTILPLHILWFSHLKKYILETKSMHACMDEAEERFKPHSILYLRWIVVFICSFLTLIIYKISHSK